MSISLRSGRVHTSNLSAQDTQARASLGDQSGIKTSFQKEKKGKEVKESKVSSQLPTSSCTLEKLQFLIPCATVKVGSLADGVCVLTHVPLESNSCLQNPSQQGNTQPILG